MLCNFEVGILKKRKVKRVSCKQLVKSLKVEWRHFLSLIIKFISYVKQTIFPPQNKLHRRKKILQCGGNLIKI